MLFNSANLGNTSINTVITTESFILKEINKLSFHILILELGNHSQKNNYVCK